VNTKQLYPIDNNFLDVKQTDSKTVSFVCHIGFPNIPQHIQPNHSTVYEGRPSASRQR